MMRGVLVTLLACASLWALATPTSWAAEGAPALFEAPAGGRAIAPAAPSRVTVRRRAVAPRLDVLVRPDGSSALSAGDRVELNLFDDVHFSMMVTDVARHAGGLTWSGTLDGVDLGQATLSLSGGALAGQVSLPGAVYRIGDAADGTPVVEQLDQAAFPPEGHPRSAPSPGGGTREDEAPQSAADSASQIDVMVLYTASARLNAGGTAAVRAEVGAAVAAANQAYAFNGLAQRLRLVYAGETSLVETNDFDADLDRVTADPVVRWLRNATRADLVSLIVDNGTVGNRPAAAFCGISFLLRTNTVGFAPSAFSVVERLCATGNLTFPHELGHNMGAQHDPYVAPGGGTVEPYSHGYVDVVGQFRTIMAYNDQCGAAGITCVRIGAFSSPNKTYSGRTIGTAETSDNARTLGETAGTVANFRAALSSPLTVAAAVNQVAVTVGQTVVASAGVDHAGGLSGAADFYAGLLLPDGRAVFFTTTPVTPTSGYAFGTITDVKSYRPIATGVPLGAPFSASVPGLFAYSRAAGDPPGGLTLFVLAVKSGALADGTLSDDELLAASLAPFAFPASPPGDAPQ
jgi:peptidyl-Asp metalloendopeptidase